jgi:hypothetical protein
MMKALLYIALGIFICYMWSDPSADRFKNDMKTAFCYNERIIK